MIVDVAGRGQCRDVAAAASSPAGDMTDNGAEVGGGERVVDVCTDDSTADRSPVRPAWITGCELPPRFLPGIVFLPVEEVHVVTQEDE